MLHIITNTFQIFGLLILIGSVGFIIGWPIFITFHPLYKKGDILELRGYTNEFDENPPRMIVKNVGKNSYLLKFVRKKNKKSINKFKEGKMELVELFFETNFFCKKVGVVQSKQYL